MTEIFFLTSNLVKLNHARFLCRHYDLKISKQKHYGVSYNEPRIKNREKLLEVSFKNAVERWQKNTSSPGDKFFFIEDTSVIIKSLSSENEEVPGVDIKYWMKETSFKQLDLELKRNGNDREVTVRSDIVLKLVKDLQQITGKEYFQFTSQIHGKVTDREFDFGTNLLYPWLDNQSFNKWFIPNGYSKPVSMLTINEAEKNDFRREAFNKMLSYLENYRFIKKTPFFGVGNKKETTFGKQSNLFKKPINCFLITGPSCAGKTTIAQYISTHYSFYHIEASDFMHLAFYKRHGFNSNTKIGDFATKALKADPGIVVREVIQEVKKVSSRQTIITGFRSEKEVEIFNELYDQDDQVEIVCIDASQEIRFNRCNKRNRRDHEIGFKKFQKKDEQQMSMGLDKIKSNYANKIIYNENSIPEYYDSFENEYFGDIKYFKGLLQENLDGKKASLRLEESIILTLYQIARDGDGEYYTTTEVAHKINDILLSGIKNKNKNNVSRYFNQYLYPYYEYLHEDGKLKVKISQTGIGKARLLIRKVIEN